MTAQAVILGQGDRAQPGGGDGDAFVTRFAPSPTGRLHLGHAYSAILAHDRARDRGGRFLLRIEDIDPARSRPEHIDAIIADLAWLGLDWEGPVYQSKRLALYADALDHLKRMGLIYPCFCTRAEIADSLSAPHGPGGAVYPGTCRILSATERAARMDEPHCWRLDMAAAQTSPAAARHRLCWVDDIAGEMVADPAPQGDVILARKDAPASYHLAVSVDDAAQGVTDVIRGVDLFAATHIHRLLQALLSLPTPRYHHHPLITDAHGERLAKRTHAPTLAALRDAGEDGAMLAERLRAVIANSPEKPTLYA